MRHHVATMAHVKSPALSKKVSKFMYHTQSVHDKNYVTPLAFVNRGVVENYLAKLEETTLFPKEPIENPVNERHIHIPDEEEEISDDDGPKAHKRRRRWTEEEKNIVISEFSEYIKKVLTRAQKGAKR